MLGTAPAAPLPPWRRVTVSDLLILWVAGLIFVVGVVRTPPMADLGVYLLQGQEMANIGGLADVDHFTHTVQGVRFVNGTWLAQRLLYGAWKIGGKGGLRTLAGVSFFFTALLVGMATARRSGRAKFGFLGAALADLAIWQSTAVRPELFAMPLCAGYLVLAFAREQRWWHLGLGFLISALWANVHGSFPLAASISLAQAGGSFLGVFAEEWIPGVPGLRRLAVAMRRDALAAAAALAGSLANPYGPALYEYLRQNSHQSMARGIWEWAPPMLGTLEGCRLLLLLAVLGAAVWLGRRRHDLRILAPGLVLCFLGSLGLRFLVWTGLTLPFVLAGTIGNDPKPPAPLKPVRPLLSVLLGLETAALLLAVTAAKWRDDWAGNNPVALAGWARDHGIEGRVFQPMEWGGVIGWELRGSVQLFVDNRVWIFSDSVWGEYEQIRAGGPTWESALDARGVRYAILDETMSRGRLGEALAASSRWEQVYEDRFGRIFRRRGLGPEFPPARQKVRNRPDPPPLPMGKWPE